MARWTLPLILWSKSLIGNNTALWWYLILELITVNVIYAPMWKLGVKLGGWYPELDQEEWKLIQNDLDKVQIQRQPKWKRRINKLILPAFAVGFSARQLYVTSNRFPNLKKKLQKSLLKMVGDSNYVHKMLLGETDIPREKIENFKTMSGGRWSGHLNNRNDRDMKVLPEGKFTANLLDVDIARHLYNETQLG